MLAGISLTCFTASYAVALALEATRMWFRSGVRGALMLGFGAAGLFAQTAFLAYRAVTGDGTPLSSEFDWYLIAAWALAVVYFMWTIGQINQPNERRTAFGLFLLPLVLALVAAAHFFADRVPLDRERAAGVWIVIHFALIGSGVVSVLLGFATGVMDLVQSRRLKNKLPPQQGLRLPSLEWLERVGVRTVYCSFVLLGLGLVAGIVLNLVRGEFSWADPVVWRGGAIVGWLGAAAAFVFLYKPARQGRKVAYLTIASFLVVAASRSLGHVLPSEHARPTPPVSKLSSARPQPCADKELAKVAGTSLPVSASPRLPLFLRGGDA